MTTYDEKWNMQHEQLVEFEQITGHCVVPQKHEQDEVLGLWVRTKRTIHDANRMRPDRKTTLDEIDFVWKVEGPRHVKLDDKLWHQQCEKLLEHKQKNGHCKVPHRHEKDKALGIWVFTQRRNHKIHKMRLDPSKESSGRNRSRLDP
jgi:NhaP-type Na+/H+ and K+/H+ antiporter